MGRIIIDGRSFTGNNITIRNGIVTIDGKAQDGAVNGVVEVRVVEGTIERLDCDAAVMCNNVNGSVSAGGSVTCHDVAGSISAGGSVRCAKAGGHMSAGGSIRVG